MRAMRSRCRPRLGRVWNQHYARAMPRKGRRQRIEPPAAIKPLPRRAGHAEPGCARQSIVRFMVGTKRTGVNPNFSSTRRDAALSGWTNATTRGSCNTVSAQLRHARPNSVA